MILLFLVKLHLNTSWHSLMSIRPFETKSGHMIFLKYLQLIYNNFTTAPKVQVSRPKTFEMHYISLPLTNHAIATYQVI